MTLNAGVLTDSDGRIGGIVANRQFQFDGPPSQAGTIYNAGFSVCSNGSLALGGSAIFYQCVSGGMSNLYDESVAAQCNQVLLNIVTQAGESPVMTMSDGQPTAVAATKNVICQIGDGQIQQNTCTTVLTPQTVISQKSDGQPIIPTAAVLSQGSDGQPVVGTSSASALASASTVPTPAVVANPTTPASNQTVASATITSSPTKSVQAISTGAATALGMNSFALVAGLVALFAL